MALGVRGIGLSTWLFATILQYSHGASGTVIFVRDHLSSGFMVQEPTPA